MFYTGEVPFVRFLIPIIVGIISARLFAHPFFINSGLGFCLFTLCIFLFLLIKYKRFSLFRMAWIFGLIIHLFLYILSFSLTVYYSDRFDPLRFNNFKTDLLILKVQTEPKLTNATFRFEGEVIGVYTQDTVKQSSGKILISLEADSNINYLPDYGDILLIPALYHALEPPYNPGEFDYKAFMENRQIYFQSFVPSDQFQVLARDAGNPVISFALSLRRELIGKYNNYLPDPDAAALASTLILGYRADLNKDVIEAYSKTGTMHVLSVSGMHVGIVFLVLSVLLRPMDKSKPLILIRILFILSAIWFYALISGFSSPVCRAALMISFVVIGKALKRNQNSYNLIAVSAFFLLLYNPFYLFDVGFQLSYLAVCGLVYFHPKLYHTLYFRNKFIDYVWSYSALSVAAQLATFPLSLYYFHHFPLYFLISNLLIVLPVTIIMYTGILLLAIPFKLLLVPIGIFLSELIHLTNNTLFRIENLPYASLSGLWINGIQLFLVCTLILTLSLGVKFRLKSLMISTVILFLILQISFSMDRILNYRKEELIFFSLRNKSAIAYTKRTKSIVLADFESTDRTYSYSIKPALESRGSPEIHLLDIESQFKTNSYWSDSNFMQFGNFRVLRWDRKISLPNMGKRLKVDILVLSQNPVQDLEDINAIVEFKKVLIDPTNTDYKIKFWLAEAAKLNLSVYVLKNSPAYIIKL
ncbi:MAG: ComEC/Rec2 family competence protein [Daejeonella sp.]|uniref:ComEC/Rec2 family competence protein n=1 Tax=Daejeonella sp. TaxID=2805397 RepID=UPI0027376B24|nr:ComEC/Rec2 family competence protein [Daejeonella sp.]MDP3466744.1 ComEC/Rec2 family competence protein [Daejeonella sp.]